MLFFGGIMSEKTNSAKEKIVKAGVEVVRQGLELSARNLAKQMGVSTQPIYSSFKSMQAIEEEVKKEIQSIHKKMSQECLSQGIPVYQALGLSFVKFAREQQQLFSFLYLNFSEQDTFSVDYIEMATDEMCKKFGVEKQLAYKFHLDMLIFCYGFAVMQTLGQEASDKVVLERLKFEHDALCKMYGIK